jgi:hypothetical protein
LVGLRTSVSPQVSGVGVAGRGCPSGWLGVAPLGLGGGGEPVWMAAFEPGADAAGLHTDAALRLGGEGTCRGGGWQSAGGGGAFLMTWGRLGWLHSWRW